jgi:ferrous iron transport protein B
MSEFSIALLGNPNSGKTSLFNALTGSRQKVANYAGVTVEKKEGTLNTPSGRRIHVIDLPGTYSLDAKTPDEQITRDVILGQQVEQKVPDVVVVVVDATNLERNLTLVLELQALKIPLVLALNMVDLAIQRKQELDLNILRRELGLEVIPTVAITGKGIEDLLKQVEAQLDRGYQVNEKSKNSEMSVVERFKEVDRILKLATKKEITPSSGTERIDRIVLHPVFGTLILIVVLSLMFQAIFGLATVPQDWIKSGFEALGAMITAVLPTGPLQSLIVEGMLAGVGAVVVFLPQILLLFLFILTLEDLGYMARAAFLMDRIMSKVGLHGRAFIPLLSSYACAVPGIMAARTIQNKKDRFLTIMIAPLTTCSARLPVYTLLIGAFIPNREVFGPFRLQGLVMLFLYVSGIVAALGMAKIFRITMLKGPKPHFVMELPTYKLPSPLTLLIGLLERGKIFLNRAGTVILTVSILLWFLASYPGAPAGALEPKISYSFAGMIGKTLEPFFAPIGFDWKIIVALIPGLAAREVMVGALSTVYAVDAQAGPLSAILARDWSLATGLSLLVWYVFACQCTSTLAVTKRETNSWTWPALMFTYMFVLAYVASWITYRIFV